MEGGAARRRSPHRAQGRQQRLHGRAPLRALAHPLLRCPPLPPPGAHPRSAPRAFPLRASWPPSLPASPTLSSLSSFALDRILRARTLPRPSLRPSPLSSRPSRCLGRSRFFLSSGRSEIPFSRRVEIHFEETRLLAGERTPERLPCAWERVGWVPRTRHARAVALLSRVPRGRCADQREERRQEVIVCALHCPPGVTFEISSWQLGNYVMYRSRPLSSFLSPHPFPGLGNLRNFPPFPSAVPAGARRCSAS